MCSPDVLHGGMSDSPIEWTDLTWNPVRGCRRVSPGCQNCYAEKTANRFRGPGHPYHGLIRINSKGTGVWTGRTRTVPEKLAEPLSWRARAAKLAEARRAWDEGDEKTRAGFVNGRPERLRVFVNSMSDLFHEDVSNEFIAAVYGVMAACPDIDFLLLTKRPARMVEWYEWLYTHGISNPDIYRPDLQVCEFYAETHTYGELAWTPRDEPWPLPNVHVGVSVEDQQRADERIPLLLKVPAAVRWVSAEPLLGPVDLRGYVEDNRVTRAAGRLKRPLYPLQGEAQGRRVDWLVIGGESGPGARPYDLSWPRALIEQCKGAGVPVFHKQIGSGVSFKSRDDDGAPLTRRHQKDGGTDVFYVHPKGANMNEWPEELRVREYPG